MLKQTLIAALFAVGSYAFNSQYLNLDQIVNQKNGDVTPQPGAIEILSKVSSASGILSYFCALGPNYTVNGKVFDINFEQKFAGIDVNIKQVNITTVTVGSSSIAFVGESDTLRATLKDINIDLAVDASASGLIPLVIQTAQVKNLTIELDLAITSDDQVHWQLVESSVVSLEDIDIVATKAFWNKTFKTIKPEVLGLINNGIKVVEGMLTGAVDALNLELANQKDDSFVLDVKGLPLNLTMTKAPEFSNAEDRISIHIDGMFVSDDMSTYVTPNTKFADFSSQPKQLDQIWIHQSMIDSLLYDLSLPLSGSGFEKQIFSLLTNLREHYGADVTCDGLVTIPNEANSSPISLSAAKGLIIGDETQGGLALSINVLCAPDATTEKELSATINTGIHLLAEVTFDNFELTAALNEAEAMNTKVISYIGDLDYHNYDRLLTSVLKGITDDINIRFSDGVDFKKNLIVKFVSGIVKNTLVSSAAADEFLFAGFRMLSDDF